LRRIRRYAANALRDTADRIIDIVLRVSDKVVCLDKPSHVVIYVSGGVAFVVCCQDFLFQNKYNLKSKAAKVKNHSRLLILKYLASLFENELSRWFSFIFYTD
jgi:hypothetical protein